MSRNGKFIKLASQEGGSYTASQNRVNFHLSAGDYDFNQSYFALYCRVGDNSGQIHELCPQWAQDIDIHKPELENVCLVRNAMLSSSTKGRLEDIRRVDVLRQNLTPYLKSTSELMSSSNKKLSCVADRYEIRRNPFVKLNRVGSTASSYERVPVLIPMKEVFELGSTQWSEGMGDCDIRLELNLKNIGVNLVNPQFPLDIENAVKAIDEKSDANSTPVGDYTTLTLTNPMRPELEEQLPYYVGQALLIERTITGGASPGTDTEPRIIQSIDYDATTYKVTLTFNAVVGTFASGETHSFVIAKTQPESPTFEVEYAEVVLFQSNVPYPMPANAMFRTWTTEEFTGSAVRTLQRQYEVEPNAVNLLAMNLKGDLIATNNSLDKFRLRVNGEDVNDRDTELGNYALTIALVDNHFKNPSGLYYNNISETLMNMGKPLKNMNELVRSVDTLRPDEFQVKSTGKTTLIATPLHMTQNMKLVQLNLESKADDISHVVLFKNVVRALN